MAQQPTYLIAPNWTFRPHTGPIALGNIIADPFRPQRVLTYLDATSLVERYPRIERMTETHSMTRESKSNISVAIWTQFLQTASLRSSGERAASNLNEYTMDSLATEYFVSDPEPAEIEARVNVPAVRRTMQSGSFRFTNPVYMVSGVKIAKNFGGKKESAKKIAASAEGGGSVPTVSGDVAIGAKAAGSRNGEERDEWVIEGDVVIAYQLLIIELKRFPNKKLLVDEYTPKAAFLGLRDNSQSETDGNDDQYEISYREAFARDLGTEDEDNLEITTVSEESYGQATLIQLPAYTE